MIKKIAPFILFLLIFCTSFSAHAAAVCVVVSKQIPPYIEAYEGLKEEMGSEMERFDLDGSRERGGTVVSSVLSSGCRVVVAVGSLALDVLRLQISDRPIIYTMVAAPSGTIKEAKNIYGINIEPQIESVFGWLKRIMPNANKIGVVYDPGRSGEYVSRTAEIAKQQGIKIIGKPAKDMKSLAGALDELLPSIDVLLMVPDPVTAQPKAFEFMLLESLRRKVPLVGLSEKHVRSGGLFSLVADYKEIGRQTASMVKKAMSGAPDIEKTGFPKNVMIVINMKTADLLGLNIAPSIISEAREVYK